MLVIDVTRDNWPPAVTDGLALTCHDCATTPTVGFNADDAEWDRVVPDSPARRSVLCLGCFVGRGGDVTKVQEVQVVGHGVTALFHPGRAYRYPRQQERGEADG